MRSIDRQFDPSLIRP
nr:unnamed protein product [Callosobruchus chinensis]